MIMKDLFSELIAYSETDYYPYHMPGHKRRAMGTLVPQLADIDITEIDGFDNLHQPEGILRELQQQTACLYGAEESFWLVNGSTCGILSAISCAVPKGGHILMARNCHKAAYHAVYLRELKVTYLYPKLQETFPLYQGISAEQVKQALQEEPDIQAVFLVSPTYEGRISDIVQIAKVVHAHGIPLIVDEAHGAHLGFHPAFAENSNRCGADLVIHSVHKTLPAMTQTALLHVNGSLINRDLLRRFLRIYQSSSPSYVLMGSIGNALQLLEERGEELFTSFVQKYSALLEAVDTCKVLRFVPAHKEQDMGKLVILCPDHFINEKGDRQRGISGQQLYDILRERFHLQPEMAAGNYCLAMFTLADEQQGYDRMREALLTVDKELLAGTLQQEAPTPIALVQIVKLLGAKACGEMRLKDAWDCPTEWVPLQEATGRIAGEFVNLYPPGVPLVVPGEQITEQLQEIVESYSRLHLSVHGIQIQNNMTYVSVIKHPVRK